MSEDSARGLDRAVIELCRFTRPAVMPRPLDGPIRDGAGLTVAEALAIFDAQCGSRHLDLAMRALKARGVGYYTIGSSGHEGNAAVAAALRPTDPALLHYRSGAFYLARAAQVPGIDGLLDVLLGAVAARDEPIAGGRHKVFGRRELAISPQTSTIASHLPRALGLAFAIERAKKLGLTHSDTPGDAIVCCTFGDASLNHASATAALNAAAHTSFSGLRLPLLFVCEDNGIGISVPTPRGWVEASQRSRPGLAYFAGDGTDLVDAWRAAHEAVRYVRERRRPAFLHLSVVRLLAHAGSDVELGYRTPAQIRAAEARDPVLATARLLIEAGVAMESVLERYERARLEVGMRAEDAARRDPLRDADDVMAPLAPRRPDAIEAEVTRVTPARRPATTLAGAIDETLGELLERYPEMLVFGEDVAKKGGVYGVTRGLEKRAGPARVFDTLLDEQTILGLALGCAQHGLLPFPEIQYLAYLHNALDQLRGEASSLRFFSKGAYTNPMVVRVAGLAYQKGFGGHFHNDHSVAALRDIPGLVIAAPSRADDAAAQLRTCAAAAKVDGAVCVFLEPIALYHTRDLHAPGDEAWTFEVGADHVPLGAPRVYGDGAELLLVSFANGVPMSLRVARQLEDDGAAVRVLDLRWLAPLPEAALLEHARACGRVLVVDETRRSGGVSEAIFTALIDRGYRGALARVTSRDSFVPLGPAADHVLLGEAEILAAARAMLRKETARESAG